MLVNTAMVMTRTKPSRRHRTGITPPLMSAQTVHPLQDAEEGILAGDVVAVRHPLARLL